MPKLPDSIGIKISELGDAGVIKENDVVPINAKTSAGVPFTKSTKINDLRQTLGFENAFLSVDAGLNGTVSGDVFFVYESAAKLWVLQYQNNDGVANPILGYDNEQVRLPTTRKSRITNKVTDLNGTDFIPVNNKGGSLTNTIVSVFVDAFGADPTGKVDSSAAVIAAVNSVISKTNSSYDGNNSKYIEVIFGPGIYILGDVPLFTGVRYRGQGVYVTRIHPKSGAGYCFTTIGTKNIDQATSSSDRLFHGGVCDLSIGTGYQSKASANYVDPPLNVGGIFVKNASYMEFKNIAIRFLDGCGIDAVELFDSDIENVQMMSVGNARNQSDPTTIVPALRLMPDGDYSSTNAVRLHAIHIEECPKHLHIGPRTRHVFFTGSCKFEGGADTFSSTITGTNGVVFVSPELTWQRSDIPMFEAASGSSGVTSSYGLVFQNPICISAPTTKGYYFHCASSVGVIQINDVFARDAYLIASGSQIQVNGGNAFRSGPYLFNFYGDCSLNNFSSFNTTVTDPLHAINLSGTGNTIRGNKFISAGSLTDSTCVVAIGATATDNIVEDNFFGGTRGYAMILGNTAADALVRNNYSLTGASFGTFIKNSQPRLGFYQAKGKVGIGGTNTSITAGSTGLLSIVDQGSLFSLWVQNSSSVTNIAALLASYELSTVNIVSQVGTKFKSDITGSAVGDGFIYVTKDVNTNVLKVINYTTLTITVRVGSLSASLVN